MNSRVGRGIQQITLRIQAGVEQQVRGHVDPNRDFNETTQIVASVSLHLHFFSAKTTAHDSV